MHTGSFFLGGFGMLQILLSMPLSLFIYRTVFGIEFVTQLHVLSVRLPAQSRETVRRPRQSAAGGLSMLI